MEGGWLRDWMAHGGELEERSQVHGRKLAGGWLKTAPKKVSMLERKECSTHCFTKKTGNVSERSLTGVLCFKHRKIPFPFPFCKGESQTESAIAPSFGKGGCRLCRQTLILSAEQTGEDFMVLKTKKTNVSERSFTWFPSSAGSGLLPGIRRRGARRTGRNPKPEKGRPETGCCLQ